MGKKVRMGVIGVGNVSRNHIRGIQNSADGELIAICDINPQVLKEKGDLYEIPESHRFNSHIELLECPDIDAVSICTPNNVHYPIAMDAIRYKKPFALEKPVTITYQQAKEIKEAAEKSQIPNMVCFSYRFKSAARYAKWLIEKEALAKSGIYMHSIFRGGQMTKKRRLYGDL